MKRMNQETKSLIRHILTALGFLLSALGVAHYAELVDLLLFELDTAWDAGVVLVGIVMQVIGFFKDKGRFTDRPEKK